MDKQGVRGKCVMAVIEITHQSHTHHIPNHICVRCDPPYRGSQSHSGNDRTVECSRWLRNQ